MKYFLLISVIVLMLVFTGWYAIATIKNELIPYMTTELEKAVYRAFDRIEKNHK